MLPHRTGRHAAVVKSSLDNYMGLFDRIGMQASLAAPESIEGFLAFKERRSPELGAPGPAGRRPALSHSSTFSEYRI